MVIGKALAADFTVEQTRHREHAVAQHLGIQAEWLLRHSRRLSASADNASLRRSRRLAIGAGSHDQAMHVLEAITALDELDRQPIEEFGMRRPAAVEAEVVGSIDEANAEVIMPEAIDQDPAEEGIVGRVNRLGQLQAACSFRSVGGEAEVSGFAERRQPARGDQGAGGRPDRGAGGGCAGCTERAA